MNTSKPLLLLLAHGSSDANWVATFERMTESITSTNPAVKLVYMELAEPSLPGALKVAREEGYTHVRVLPLFLAAGRHLRVDIPRMLDEADAELGLSTTLLPPVGERPEIADALLRIISDVSNQKH